MGFSIAFTDIATEMGLTETEKGSVFAAYYFGYALTQVRTIKTCCCSSSVRFAINCDTI